MVQSVNLDYKRVHPAKAPLPAEGKEFLLTERGQSVMNIFTAFGSVCNFVFVSREGTTYKNTNMPRGNQLQ
jgi:hypothetical protein